MAILHYLRDHPTAKDSAAGIAKWWVGEAPELVEKALALLVKEGVIEKKRQLYQIARQHGCATIENTLRQWRRKI